mmetsp:Transcript_83467/g.223467  ORF Transcript_83467/g.223467 Transcript_83467/m.223467 type:complete len:115 (-) Transcript_83467:791-1135(-)
MGARSLQMRRGRWFVNFRVDKRALHATSSTWISWLGRGQAGVCSEIVVPIFMAGCRTFKGKSPGNKVQCLKFTQFVVESALVNLRDCNASSRSRIWMSLLDLEGGINILQIQTH